MCKCYLGTGQPCPVVGIGSPGVRVLDGEGQPIVDSSHRNARLHGLLVLSGLARLDILYQPVVVASVCVPDDVVQHHKLLELELEADSRVAVERFRLKLPQVEVCVLEVLYEALQGADLGWQAESVELPAHLGKMFVDNLLGFGLFPVDPEIVEGLRGQLDDFRIGHHVEAELLVHEAGPGLGHVALVGDEAGPTKAAGTADTVHPFGPLGVQTSVRLLVFRFIDADSFPICVLDEVAAAGALVDPDGVHPLVDGRLRLADDVGEGGIICKNKSQTLDMNTTTSSPTFHMITTTILIYFLPKSSFSQVQESYSFCSY